MIANILIVIVLPLVVQPQYRKICTAALVNIIYQSQYKPILSQYVIDYERTIQILITIGLIALFILNWFGDNLLSGISISIALTGFICGANIIQTILVVISQKLILIMYGTI
jgi:hypothetical protein